MPRRAPLFQNGRLAALASPAFAFVLAMGVVNLFGDVVYEGGAAINGPFLASLGAGAAAISIVAGAAEFLGYALRPFAGALADRSGRFWALTLLGYAVNLAAVPALALAGSWPVAAALVMAERTGRAIRKPTVEAMLSYTTGELGRGWVYGLNTALDETGATLGPLLVLLALARGATWRTAYALLAVSAVLAFAALLVARARFPAPRRLERGETAPARGFTRAYGLAMAGGGLFAAGLMSFEFVSFHLARTGTVPLGRIPLFLVVGTLVSALASPLLGRLHDRRGLPVLVACVAATACFPPLVFSGRLALVWAGILLWGLGYAVQDTLLKAVIAGLLPRERRGAGFGVFYVGYGTGWLLGSVAVGLLYVRSLPLMIAFAVAMPLASLPLFALSARAARAGGLDGGPGVR